jgi:hypothetical protein
MVRAHIVTIDATSSRHTERRRELNFDGDATSKRGDRYVSVSLTETQAFARFGGWEALR